MIATSKVIVGGVDLSPEGITWVDREYDEKMGAGLRPVYQDRGGFPIGLDMRDGVVAILEKAFFLGNINLPNDRREMTAYEFSERMKQFRRENLPLFAPMESEYNGQLCESAFDVAMQAGFLGSPMDIPESLQGENVKFDFVSPLTESEEEEKANRFAAVRQMLGETVAIDPDVAMEVDMGAALRDAILGIGAPAGWLNPEEQVAQARQAKMLATAAEAAGPEGMAMLQQAVQQ
jgi:hypothetical protein